MSRGRGRKRRRTSEKNRNRHELAKLDRLTRAPRNEVTVDDRVKAVGRRRVVELLEGQTTKALELVLGGPAAGPLRNVVEGRLVRLGPWHGEESGEARFEDGAAEEGGRIETVPEKMGSDGEATGTVSVDEVSKRTTSREEKNGPLSPDRNLVG